MLEGVMLFIAEGFPLPLFWFFLNLLGYINLYLLVRFFGYRPKKGYSHFVFLAAALAAISIIVHFTSQIHGWRNVYTLCITPFFINTAVALAVEGKNKVLTTWLGCFLESLTLFTSLSTALFSKHLPMYYENRIHLLTANLSTSAIVFTLFLCFVYKKKTTLFDLRGLKQKHLVIILVSVAAAEIAGGAFHAFSGVRQDDFYVRAVTSGYSMMVVSATALLIKFLGESAEKHYYLEQARINEALVEKQRQYYDLLLDREKETKKFQHDIKNHFSCIDYLLKKEAYGEATDYLDDVLQRAEELKLPLETGNEVLNAVVSDLLHRFRNVNFKINWTGRFLPANHIASADLCIIFANALTNAIEAIEKLKSSETETVTVSIKSVGENLYVLIQNPCAKLIHADGKHFGTDKPDKTTHGFGVQNMIECIERYGGSVYFTSTTHSFAVEMVFLGALNAYHEKGVTNGPRQNEVMAHPSEG